jgi:hypothetical protein
MGLLRRPEPLELTIALPATSVDEAKESLREQTRDLRRNGLGVRTGLWDAVRCEKWRGWGKGRTYYLVRFRGELRESGAGVVLRGAITEPLALTLLHIVFAMFFLAAAAGWLALTIVAIVSPSVSNAEIPAALVGMLAFGGLGVGLLRIASPFQVAAEELADLMRLLERTPPGP